MPLTLLKRVVSKRGGGRAPLSYTVRAPLLLDLQHRQKLRSYVAVRTCEALAMDMGVGKETIRKVETNDPATCKVTSLTPEQKAEVRAKRQEYRVAAAELRPYRLKNLARHYGIAIFTVVRLQRTLWGEPYEVRR